MSSRHSKRALAAFAVAAAATLAAVASSGTLAAVASSGTSVAEARGLTAVRVRVGDHPAFVRAVVDFAHGSVNANQVQASDPQPGDGAASLRVYAPTVRIQAAPRSADGITVTMTQGAGRIRIDIASASRRFKYLSYAVVGSNRLAIDLWKSAPPTRAAEIRHGSGGCLTLGGVTAQPGSVSASGRERYVFENRIAVVVRGQDGRSLAHFSVTGSGGHWSAQVGYRVGHTQPGTLEAVSLSAKDGALACILQVRVRLRPVVQPTAVRDAVASSPPVGAFPGAPQSQQFSDGSTCPVAPANRYLMGTAACLSVRMADVDGDGRRDLVLLSSQPGVKQFDYRFTLTVYRASGGTLSAQLPIGDIPATFRLLRDVNGRAGVEIFVHFVHVSTSEVVAIYSFGGGKLRRSGELSYGGSDSSVRFGFTCQRQIRPAIVEDSLALVHSPQLWSDRATTYEWVGAKLRRGSTKTITFESPVPPNGKVGVHC